MLIANKRLIGRCILAILIVLTLAFIWSNSLENAEVSSDKSGKVIEIVKPIVDPEDKIDDDMFVNIVRKLAHFSEFALLGMESFLFAVTFRKKGRTTLPYAGVAIGGAFLCAVTDELLQLTSEGRSCQFLDMMIDLAGIITGVCIVLFLRMILLSINLLNKKKKNK